MSTAYEKDFYAWANEQAALLRSGKLAEADIEHIAEEIESMGKTEKRELVSRLTVLLLHLLKWRFQPNLQSASWRATIEVQRLEIGYHLEDNPSLKHLRAEAMSRAYSLSIREALRETGLPESTFPAICPWSFEQIMEKQFWPDGNA